MNFSYDRDADCGYFKFTDNKIAKTETVADNIYVDFDKDHKPVGVEVLGNEKNIETISKLMEDTLSGLEDGRLKDITIEDYIKELEQRFGKAPGK